MIAIDEYIKQANAEYELNGRSDKFVKMEDKIINAGNTLLIYFFARYTHGIDVDKFQSVMLEKAPFEECFYFVQHVDGASWRMFLEKAVQANDYFWCVKFIRLGERCKEVEDAQQLYDHYGIERPKRKNSKSVNDDVDMVISRANREFDANGHSEQYIQWEKEALYSFGDGNLPIYAKFMKGIDLKAIQKSAMLRGNPLTFLTLAQEIDGVNKALILRGLRLAKLDYVEIENDMIRRMINPSENNLTYNDLIDVYESKIKQIINAETNTTVG